jgi:hypothetical protein
MRIDRLVILSFLLTAIGVVWLATHWNGTFGFSFAYPLAGCNLTFNVTNTGASALFGVLFTVMGLVLFFISFVGAIINSLSGPKRA